MVFDGRNVDLEKVIHEIATQYGLEEVEKYIDDCVNEKKPVTLTGKLEAQYSGYLKAYGYLCRFPNGYVINELSHVK